MVGRSGLIHGALALMEFLSDGVRWIFTGLPPRRAFFGKNFSNPTAKTWMLKYMHAHLPAYECNPIPISTFESLNRQIFEIEKITIDIARAMLSSQCQGRLYNFRGPWASNKIRPVEQKNEYQNYNTNNKNYFAIYV